MFIGVLSVLFVTDSLLCAWNGFSGAGFDLFIFMQDKHLITWLSDERGEKFFGRAFKIKASILAHLITGEGSLSEIARQHGISRQAVHEHAQRGRKIYFSASSRLT